MPHVSVTLEGALIPMEIVSVLMQDGTVVPKVEIITEDDNLA